jgi:tripartite-type tricarboxylate transporter receptor subunit TctC
MTMALAGCSSTTLARKEGAVRGLRGLLAAVVLVGALTLVATALLHAQPASYPSRPVTLVVPIAPGGGIDTIARVFAERLRERLGQPVVVENRVGAGGLLGADLVAKSAPDGYTLLLTTTAEAIAKWLHRNVPFDALADFAPVAELARAPLVLLVEPALPVGTLDDLVRYAKANPGKLSYGTPGVGTPHHLVGEALKRADGLDLVHIPYRGTGPSLTGLLSGQVPMILATTIAVMPFVQSGKVRALVVAGDRRTAILPEVPTLTESGFPGIDVESWFGVAAPAGTPAAVIERLHRELQAVAESEDVRTRLSAQGFVVAVSTPAAFRQSIATEHARFGRMIAEFGLQPQ